MAKHQIKTMTCPNCRGFGRSATGIRCMRCEGTGWVNAIQAEWIRAGLELRRCRWKANLLRHQGASRLGISTQELVEMEMGWTEPISIDEFRRRAL